MNKKIVFFDIDGTIYLYGKGVPQDTIEAIKQLKENGNLAILCTGRTKSMIFPEIENIGFDGIIAGGGTYVEFGGKEISRYVMDKELTIDIIETMRNNNIMAIPEGIEHMYFDKELMPESYYPIFELYKSQVGENVIEIQNVNDVVVSKVSGVANTDNGVFSLKEKFGDRFTFVEHLNKYIEMIPNGYSKAVGISELIKYLKMPWENTYAFGDSMNDYEMLKYVKYGVAMGNADDGFKSQMNYVTEDYDKGGIKNALMRFGLI